MNVSVGGYVGDSEEWTDNPPSQWLSTQTFDREKSSERKRTIVDEDLAPLFVKSSHRLTPARLGWLYAWLSPHIRWIELTHRSWSERGTDKGYCETLAFLRLHWNSDLFHPFISRQEAEELTRGLGHAIIRLSSSIPGYGALTHIRRDLVVSLAFMPCTNPTTGLTIYGMPSSGALGLRRWTIPLATLQDFANAIFTVINGVANAVPCATYIEAQKM